MYCKDPQVDCSSLYVHEAVWIRVWKFCDVYAMTGDQLLGGGLKED